MGSNNLEAENCLREESDSDFEFELPSLKWSVRHDRDSDSDTLENFLATNFWGEKRKMRVGGEDPWNGVDPLSFVYLAEELKSDKPGDLNEQVGDMLLRRQRRRKLEAQNAKDTEGTNGDDANGTAVVEQFVSTGQQVSPTTQGVIVLDDDDESTEKNVHPVEEIDLNMPCDDLLSEDFMDNDGGQDSRKGANPTSENENREKISYPTKEIDLNKPANNLVTDDSMDWDNNGGQNSREDDAHPMSENEIVEYEEDDIEMEGGDTQTALPSCSDDLKDIWREMAVVLECSTDPLEDSLQDRNEGEADGDCGHVFIMKDDIGEVCRICGIIGRSIDTIIEYTFSKATRSTRTYRYEGRCTNERDQMEILSNGFNSSASNFEAAELYPHPRHRREMKPHQIEGFNFLATNLVSNNPGGCIMAHAPGSGKTFMVISFLQSFMAKYPFARPLVVLPRGILGAWKKESLRWQVEDWPLHDFYSAKAESRSQQLKVLSDWAKDGGILFLGYKQFSSIMCDNGNGEDAISCQKILLTCPTILILDEGHTPRNEETDILTSLDRVGTPRKVVLSGTLYQNHVKEVFNILNLVRPRFMKLETSKEIKRRILSRAEISNTRNLLKRDHDFYDLIENTILKDNNYRRKLTVIQDLREMTRKILHYYKGDNLDELPGLVDFSVFLQLSPKQKTEVAELRNLGQKFKINSEGSAVYVHPHLKNFSKSSSKNSSARDRVDEEKVDSILKKVDVREGAKAKFYLNLLKLCASCGEKLLVFSQYLLPLKFLERLGAKVMGYRLGLEMFTITGDLNSETRETYMESFNNSPHARVLFGSIKACGEGISLVGASRIIILDVHLNPSVTRQAIGRAFRPGQTKKVYTYRLVAANSPEEDDHITCFKKESIAKMWFEWDEYIGCPNLEMETVNVKDCGDMLLETAQMNEEVVALFRR